MAPPAPPADMTVPTNIHSLASFIPVFDGSFPVQDFLNEVSEVQAEGHWSDAIAIKVAKSKLKGYVADLVRNRMDLNHALCSNF